MAEPQLHITHPTKPLLYVLPPVHLFYSSSPIMGSKVHNWLRIHQWCLIRAINPPLHGKTLMTTPQWRIALDGKYWRVPLDRLGDVHPKSTSTEIQALPLPPLAEHHDQNTKKADRRSRQRLADRIDINVTFGVHGGFTPYDPTLDHSTWGGRVISHDEADRDEQLWAEITWELSVINFRWELITADRRLVPGKYVDDATASNRQMEVTLIWQGFGSLRPMWESGREPDVLGHADWQVRRPGVFQWGRILQDWPLGSSLSLPSEAGIEEKHFQMLERDIILFYCRSFHHEYGRLPIVPLCAPGSLLRHRRS
ncbi:hypothetical protein WOLCODRAFT_149913 [Wolfiporia cocos MD-104 SS10]|uniref:Uncharacterized protein n=1 Tax=Wolfiporia cocos (strain MD-104) TaxID=742152 RepID=A0A2H3JQ48_WOLCO|nr:hypothetical protein WOLCODRAFT_149913 [Wolfiporia cocos MD-104 SS10]